MGLLIQERNIAVSACRRDKVERTGEIMQFRKILSVELALLSLILLLTNSASSQVKGEERISFSGVIDSISKDLKFIVVNEAKILLSPTTQIMDEKGNLRKIDYLRVKRYVTIEGIRNADGIIVKRIMVKTSKPKR